LIKRVSGVGRTTPKLRGFTDTEELMTFSIKVLQDPPLGATPDSVARTYGRSISYGTVAESRLKDIGPYVTTPMVARDMLAITKAAGFEKLKYWGVSYGTLLGEYSSCVEGEGGQRFFIGQTFASMFPKNIERLVVDGVVDALDYYSGEFRNSLL
jgi:pimeloyl-ACP methyl ester carboxylesterase